MISFVRIELSGMRFYAFHGVHDIEAVRGGVFEVDVSLQCRVLPGALESDELAGTMDYEQVWSLVEARMAKRARLLEHLAADIVSSLKKIDSIMSGTVTIRKLNPPFGGMCMHVSVTLDF